MNSQAGVTTAVTSWLAGLPFYAYGWHVNPHPNAPTLEHPLSTLLAHSAHPDVRSAVAGFFIAAVFSFLPDLDHPKSTAGRAIGKRGSWVIRHLLGGHRMGSHSLIAVAFAWTLTTYLVAGPVLAWAAADGWASHIFTDLLTVQGVGLLWPLSKRKFRIGNMRTGSVSEERYVWLVSVVGLLFLILYVGQFVHRLHGGPA